MPRGQRGARAPVGGKREEVEWDGAPVKVKNLPGLDSLIKPTYRAGYTLDA